MHQILGHRTRHHLRGGVLQGGETTKKTLWLLLQALLLVANLNPSFAQWVQTNRFPDSHAIVTQSLAVSGTNLFAGTYYGGVFRTTDNGTNWTAVNTGLPDPEIFSLATSGTNLFAGTYLGVSRSTDNGTSWTPTGVHN